MLNKIEIENEKVEDLLGGLPESPVKEEVVSTYSQYESLTTEDKRVALDIANKIDYTDSESILNYGMIAQERIGSFSHGVLSHVKKQDVGDIGESIHSLMTELQNSNPKELMDNDRSFFDKLLRRTKRSIEERTAKYQSIGAQVDMIAENLMQQRLPLIEDNQTLGQLYEQNLNHYKALNIYIAAGELKMKELESEIIPNALAEAENTSDQMLVQKVSDLNHHLNRLDKRVHDLKVTRQITLQQAPQIRLIQNTNQELAEKIQSSINTAIPLWKNQVVISLTLLRKESAIQAQKQVTDATNEMLLQNSAMLKQTTIDTAHESERAVVDIETLEQTQMDLVDTLQETLEIQRNGTHKRREAEQRLATMEGELRKQMLELHQE